MESKQSVWMLWSACAPLLANMGDLIGILRMLAVLISGTETTTKVTFQLRDINGRNGLGKTTKVCVIVILRTILYKESQITWRLQVQSWL